MFLIIVLSIVCIQTVTFTADIKLSGFELAIRFEDDNMKIGVYPIEWVQKSNTVKNMLNDIGEQLNAPIPINNIRKDVYDFLIKAINTVDVTILSLYDMRAYFRERLRSESPEVSPQELLGAVIYLDISSTNIKSAIASLYADALIKTKMANEPILLYEPVRDCYKLVAGWVLHDLLIQKKWSKDELLKVRDLGTLIPVLDQTIDSTSLRPIMSSSSTPDGFSLVWKEKERRWLDMVFSDSSGSLNTVYVNFFDMNSPLKNERLSQNVLLNKALVCCTLSEDGKKLLVIDERKNSASAQRGALYASIFPDNIVVEFRETAENLKILKSVFNNKTYTFNIVAIKQNNNKIGNSEDKKSELLFYDIALDGEKRVQSFDISTQGMIGYNASHKFWYSVDGNLIGISYNHSNKTNLWEYLLYNGQKGKLFRCYTNEQGTLVYDDDKEVDAGFIVINIPSILTKSKTPNLILDNYAPFSTLFFVPNIKEIINKIGYIPLPIRSFGHFVSDMEYLRINYFDKDTQRCGMHYFFPPELAKTIKILNGESNNSDTILNDALALYAYYMTGTSDEEEIKIKLELLRAALSSKIKDIYNVNNNVPTPHSVKPLHVPQQAAGVWASLRRTPSQLLLSAQQRIQALSPFYRKLLYGMAGFSIGGFGSWLWTRYASNQKPVSH